MGDFYAGKETPYSEKALVRFYRDIVGIGASGYMSAIAFYFKNRLRDNIKIYCVQPKPDHIIPGIRRTESDMKWIHWVNIDGTIGVEKRGNQRSDQHRKNEGILIGLSSGAVVTGYNKLLKEQGLDKGDYILIFSDHGYKHRTIQRIHHQRTIILEHP